MSLEQELTDGTKARIMYESEPFQNALKAVKAGILQKWEESPISDRDGQHELRLMLKVLNDVELNIISVINNGKFAEKTLLLQKQEEQTKKKGLLSRFK